MASTLQLTILVVEAEGAIRSLMETELQAVGHRTLGVGSAKEALALAGNADNHIDMGLVDMRLPDGNGINLLQTLSNMLPNVPLVLITGHGNKSTVIEALKSGAYDYLEKPFSISNDLFPVVNRAVEAIRLQKENTSLNEQILHNSKLAALGELSATVVHDIRGPLSLIQVVCDDLEDELNDEGGVSVESLQGNIQQIRKACDRIRKLGDHLRNYSRQDKDEQKELRDIDLLLEDSLFLVQQKTRKLRIEVTKTIEECARGLQINCYPNKLEQVIMNLLSNACDAMENCETRKLTLGARLENDELLIEVSDTGTGIPTELHERIFENFFTTKPKGQGTGLGLNIVRNIVREHGGELMLKSVVGSGTTFTIRLPCTASPVALGEDDSPEQKVA